MPANLTPQYRTAEAKFKAAQGTADRRAALEEMLATIPKHKGTEKLQADLKRRLARLRQEEESRSTKHGHVVKVDPEGAAQIVLLGPPNCGKSSMLAVLTHAEPTIADYPFTTTRPQPGMMTFEDVHIQLVDLPPIGAQHLEPWLPNIIRGADAALLLADPTSPELPEDVEVVRERLAQLRIPLVSELPEDSDPRDNPLPTMMVVTKQDRSREQDIAVLRELYEPTFEVIPISATTHYGLEALKVALWRRLQLVRVYAKPPGKPADRSDPFVLPHGSTVVDLAERVHREIATTMQFARVWGGRLEGQRVAREFELRDRDIVELHI
jgi:hypothetical protein